MVKVNSFPGIKKINKIISTALNYPPASTGQFYPLSGISPYEMQFGLTGGWLNGTPTYFEAKTPDRVSYINMRGSTALVSADFVILGQLSGEVIEIGENQLWNLGPLVYSTVQTYSSSWAAVGSDVSNLSANWENTWLSVAANSAQWDETAFITPIQEASGNWNSVFSNVMSNSSTWNQAYSQINASSATWNNKLDSNVFNSLSTNWENTWGIVTAYSSNWNLVFDTVLANSAQWDESALIAPLQDASGSWNLAYSNINSNSANWNSVFSTVLSNSASWEESEFVSPLQEASGKWNEAYSEISGQLRIEKMPIGGNWNLNSNLILNQNLEFSISGICIIMPDEVNGKTYKLRMISGTLVPTEL